VEIFAVFDTFEPGKYLLAATACILLAYPALAYSQSIVADKRSGSSAIIHQKILQSSPELDSSKKNGEPEDFADICIFCHVPNMNNHKLVSPQWNNSIKSIPATRPVVNPELSR